VLTDELKWKEDVSLFATGRLAAIRLGAGIGNLEGARSGAERIVSALEDMFGLKKLGYKPLDNGASLRFAAGLGSGFEYLDIRT
jgi:hypothetical protein